MGMGLSMGVFLCLGPFDIIVLYIMSCMACFCDISFFG